MEQKTSGFASPAQGYEEQIIDLNSLLIHNPPATYFARLETGGMEALGLPRGSILIVDRSKTPTNNSFVLLRHEGEFLCRLMVDHEGKPAFTDGTSFFSPTPDETEIIGAVTSSIRIHGSETI
jgi:DNA polymerase V